MVDCVCCNSNEEHERLVVLNTEIFTIEKCREALENSHAEESVNLEVYWGEEGETIKVIYDMFGGAVFGEYHIDALWNRTWENIDLEHYQELLIDNKDVEKLKKFGM